MTFSSSWQEVSGDREGADIDATAGTHSPTWDSMDDATRDTISLATRSAEGIIQELCHNLSDEEHRFRITISGHVSDENTDGMPSYITLSVAQMDGPVAAEAPAEEPPAEEQPPAEEAPPAEEQPPAEETPPDTSEAQPEPAS